MTSSIRWLILLVVMVVSTSAVAADKDCFQARSRVAAYVRSESLELLRAAGDRSSAIATMSLGDRACAVAEKTLDGSKWVLVRSDQTDQSNKAIQGWIPLESIVYRNKMVRVENVRAQTVEVSIGDYLGKYEVQTGGAFSVWLAVGEHECRNGETPDQFGACEDWETVRGHLYHIGHAVMAISSKHRGLDLFTLRGDGTLCPRDGDVPAGCK